VAPRPSPDRAGRGRGHHRRRRARRTAIDVLFQADLLARSPAEVLREWQEAGRGVDPYTAEIVSGVEAELSGIDRIIGDHAEEWTVSRMAVLDRNILRVACWEMRAGLPVAIAINEAVEAANALSSDDSGRFVNGLLGRIAREGKSPAG
jgi:N utilization substance protein B